MKQTQDFVGGSRIVVRITVDSVLDMELTAEPKQAMLVNGTKRH